MTDAQQREAARQFFYRWNSRGKEDEDARSYWIELLQNVLGVENVTERVEFEKKLVGSKGSTERIDVYIPETKVIIEHKSLGIALDKPQPGHDMKTPYEQAKGYDNYLPYSERARWIVLSNFAEIWIYNLDTKKPEPVKLTLSELQEKYHLLDFLVHKETKKITEEVELSKAAGELVGRIRDRFLTQYNDPLAKRTQKSLNILCVRLVFCFYAEDAGLFGKRDAFSAYLSQYEPKDMRNALLELFKVLDTPLNERADLYLSDELEAFPYVNGGLFSDENIVIPKITEEIKQTLIESARFDWSKISPTIFGAVFEATLNPQTRREGGMHYTSIENIHKVIDPLFLDDLKAELEEIRGIGVPGVQRKKADAFQKKLGGLVFFDPACGSGNFLTETFLSLRRLENEALKIKMAADRRETEGQIVLGLEGVSPVQVSIQQFYGIEINDFAVAVAQTALWIAESQMLQETEGIIHSSIDFFPLKTYRGITEGNALELDWKKVAPITDSLIIMGNPPFSGGMYMSQAQKVEIRNHFSEVKGAGELDYVCAWYKIACECMAGTKAKAAFVSTNSICQGEQVITFWKYIIENYNPVLNFAYTTFVWDSEATAKAKVHCVIVGFSLYEDGKPKTIYEDNDVRVECKHINPYLSDGDNYFVETRSTPLYDVPGMRFGSMPRDGGGFALSKEEREEFLNKEPLAAKWIRPYVGATEFLNNKERYCLWMVNALPSDLKKCPMVLGRIQKVKEFRTASKAAGTRKFAETPSVFCQIAQPNSDYIIVPKTSSGRRRYLPIGFVDKNVIASDLVFLIPNATLYHFGVLMSNVHNAWMRTVAGRLKSDYRYSKDIVYNNFPWPTPTEEQVRKIEQSAQEILDARALYPDSSLADLYDPLTMPLELRKAHQRNDQAVMRAYGMPIKETDEAACVAWLMKLYQQKVSEQAGRRK